MANKENSAWLTLKLLGDIGFLVAVPLVIFGLGGRLLDKKLHTAPWLMLAGLVISLIITSISIYKKTSTILRELDEELKNLPPKNPSSPK
ncbi:AtpZ/AtpI family protein [Candidatus Uhrbacteria bacterium]|nr:AtpZ/AtpI family protein [Candidatus Uhrbacteria bacterium]